MLRLLEIARARVVNADPQPINFGGGAHVTSERHFVAEDEPPPELDRLVPPLLGRSELEGDMMYLEGFATS